MSSITRTVSAALVALALFAVAAVPAQAKGGGHGSGHGVVLAHTDADTFVYATRGGTLRAVDATTLPAVGSVVKVKARRGVAKRIRVTGTATRARLQGMVTASAADQFAVTGKKDDDAVATVLFAAPVEQPAIGRRVKVWVDIDGGALKATKLKFKGRGGLEVEGTVSAIDPAARTLTLAPEDGGTPVVLAVPVSIDLAQFAVGAKVEAKVLLLADGTYVLRGVKRDHDEKKSDDDAPGKSEDSQGRGRGHGSDD